MAFVSGPRQVGKTTTCRREGDLYLSWDILDDRRKIVQGATAVATALELDRARASHPWSSATSCTSIPKGSSS